MLNNSVGQNISEANWLGDYRPPVPDNEIERLESLSRYENPREEPVHDETFDKLASLAAQVCDKPISFINLIGSDKEFKKACFGYNGETVPRSATFCQFTIMKDDVFEIRDVQNHDLFRNHPQVEEGLNIKYYAGVPLKTDDEYNIGTLCLIGHEPDELSSDQKEALDTLADEVISRFQLAAAKQKLELKNAEKDELIRIVSHDMRNPLMGIIGFSELLQEEVQEEFHIESLEHIEQSGKSLLDIVNVLLQSDYIRNESSFIINKKRVDAVEVTKNVTDLYQPYIQLKNIDFQIAVQPGKILCELDSEKWKQIIGNLLGNAIKFTGVGGTIKLSVKLLKKHKDFLSIIIEDTGIGMDQQMLGDLFSGKDDIRRKGTEGEKSTGLGMFIVKKYTKLMNGSINVESEPGTGTTVKT